MATENDVVYSLGENAPAAGFDLSRIRQLKEAFPNFNKLLENRVYLVGVTEEAYYILKLTFWNI